MLGISLLVLALVMKLAYAFLVGRQQALDAEEHTRHERVEALVRKLVGHSEQDWLAGFERKTRPISLQFKDLGLKINGSGKIVLEGVTGEFAHSQLVALMGPSGCGKTSFLNTLSGKAFYGITTGELQINGEQRTIADFKREVGFVPQIDTVHTDLTVRENLMFAAELKLPPTTTAERRKLIVNNTIDLLGLRRVENTIVGNAEKRGVSGGQLKRVNIGLELVADPTLLFLDEPTSGLDSTSSFEVLNALKQLSRKGITVITVIHQPRFSIYSMFDSVLLLGVGGKTVYLGPTEYSLAHFERIGFKLPQNENPADFFMDLISGHIERDGDANFKPQDLFTMWAKLKDGTPTSANKLLREEEDPKQGPDAGLDSATVAALHPSWAPATTSANKLLREEEDPKRPDAGLDSATVAALHEAFLQADVGKSGKLLKWQLPKLFLGATDEDVAALLIEMDVDKDGGLTFDELINGIRAMLLGKSPAKRTVTEERQREFLLEGTLGDLSAPSARQAPSLVTQLWAFLRRASIQALRAYDTKALDLFLALFGGLVTGSCFQSKSTSLARLPTVVMMSCLVIGVVTCVAALRPFGQERMMYWRETASGASPLAYFLTKNLVFMVDTIVLPMGFLASSRFLLAPLIPFEEHALLLALCSWSSTGLGMLLSTSLSPQKSLLVGVMAPLVLAFMTGVTPSLVEMGDFSVITYFSFNRWVTEYLVVQELAVSAVRSRSVAMTAVATMQRVGYSIPCTREFEALQNLSAPGIQPFTCSRHELLYPVVALAIQGILLRIAAFLAMRLLNADKQK
jgi:ABC-type multidrug transport system ATPase subunit